MATADEFARRVRERRAIAAAQGRRPSRFITPGPLPEQQHPHAIILSYSTALLAIARATGTALGPLMNALPRLAPAARADASEEDVAKIMAEARRQMSHSLTQRDLEALASRFARHTSTFQRVQFAKQVRAGLGVDVFARDRFLPGLVDRFAAQNAALIRDIPAQTLAEVEELVKAAVASATPHPALADQIRERIGVGESRAKLIARDQVGKLYGQVNAARQRELGVRRFTWLTSGDERVRPEHARLNGQIFEYDDPPSEGLPGESVNCRCNAQPMFEDVLGALGEEPVSERAPVSVPVPEQLEPAPSAAAPIPQTEWKALSEAAETQYTPDEQTAHARYGGAWFKHVNERLRTDLPHASEAHEVRIQDTIKALDSSIAKNPAPRDFLVYRGSDLPELANLAPGDQFVDPGFLSTSGDASVAKAFAGKGKAVFEIEVPKGHPIAPLSGASESEMLLPRGTALEIISVEPGDIRKIRARVVSR